VAWNEHDAHSLQERQIKDLQVRTVYKKVTVGGEMRLEECEGLPRGRP